MSVLKPVTVRVLFPVIGWVFIGDLKLLEGVTQEEREKTIEGLIEAFFNDNLANLAGDTWSIRVRDALALDLS